MRAQLNEEFVVKANAQFWEQMLAMKMDTLPDEEEFCVDDGHMLACVALSGQWKGRIEVRMAGKLAYEATAAMLMQPVDAVGEADALDATKEIANMIAGVIKSSLPRPCAMAVPESVVEQKCFCGLPETEDTLVVASRHTAGNMMVRVLEQECLQ